MNASEAKFESIIDGTKQYIVPLFQRPYTWDKSNWEELWEDITKLYEAENVRTHFIGSLVTMPTNSGPESVTQYLLIDGQQRLTTIMILLAVLRDRLANNGGQDLANEIMDAYLVNRYKRNLGYHKLLPTQVQDDRKCFQDIIGQKMPSDSKHPLKKAYDFFERQIRRAKFGEKRIKNLIIHQLSVVSITLDPDDNPHLVFETLNARGVPLTSVDLIRNFFLMQIYPQDQEKQREVYQNYWVPMQQALEESTTEFVRHYLMKDGGDFVRKDDIYNELRLRIIRRQEDALTYLKELVKYSRYYQKLLSPESEKQPEIRAVLERLKRLDVTVIYPFLLNCYEDYSQQSLSTDEFVMVLKLLENFVLRRFVCTIPTHGLNKIFPPLYNQAKNCDDFVTGVKHNLQTKRYPQDTVFRNWLIQGTLYGRGNRQVRTKLILEELEKSFQHKEPVVFEDLSVEHVMPQKLTENWYHDLGDDAEKVHELWLHNLGNLTLTGFNSELSNSDFKTKKSEFERSHLELNKYFNDADQWTEDEIEKRAEYLADSALEIWPYFGDEEVTALPTTVTNTTPRVLYMLGDTIEVRTWRDVIEQTMNCLAESEPEMFDVVVEKFPHFVGYDKMKFRDFRELKNGAFVNVGLSAQQIYRFCLRVIDELGLTTDDWNIDIV